jgi:hypothetical protein
MLKGKTSKELLRESETEFQVLNFTKSPNAQRIVPLCKTYVKAKLAACRL